jgi:hypothetical protein
MAKITIDVSDSHKSFDFKGALLIIQCPSTLERMRRIKQNIDAQLNHEIQILKDVK